VRQDSAEVDVPLFTRATQNYLARIHITPAFADYILFLESGRAFEILERGTSRCSTFTDDPLIAPPFLSLISGRLAGGSDCRRAAHAGSASPRPGRGTVERDDDITRAFADRYAKVEAFNRLAGATTGRCLHWPTWRGY
jgi:hypothetical protein